MSGYPEEAGLDEAVRAATAHDEPGHVVIGWVVGIASRSPEDEGIHLTCFTADGQPLYATVGLLTTTLDLVRQETHDLD